MEFSVPDVHRLKLKENKKVDNYYDLVCGLTKAVGNECDNDINCNGHALTSKALDRSLEELKIWKTIKTIQTNT